MYGDPGVDGYECNEDDSSWHLSAEVDDEDWCEAACGEQQFGRGSCSNTRDWLNDVAEQVARVSEANQVQLAGFERLGGENVACRGPGTAGSADTEGYIDVGRTCISPIYSRADCEDLCRYDIGCYAYEYHRGVWDECRWREAGVTVIAHRPDCVVDTDPNTVRPVTTSSTCNRERGTGICERWKRLPVLGSAPSLTEFNGYSCWIKTTHGSALSGEVSGCAISRAQLALSSLSGCLLLTCLIIGCKLAPASYVHRPARVYSRPLLCSLSCCRGRHVLTVCGSAGCQVKARRFPPRPPPGVSMAERINRGEGGGLVPRSMLPPASTSTIPPSAIPGGGGAGGGGRGGSGRDPTGSLLPDPEAAQPMLGAAGGGSGGVSRPPSVNMWTASPRTAEQQQQQLEVALQKSMETAAEEARRQQHQQRLQQERRQQQELELEPEPEPEPEQSLRILQPPSPSHLGPLVTPTSPASPELIN